MESLPKQLIAVLAGLLMCLPLQAPAQRAAAADAATGAVVGILEGKATLIRQAARFALAEGVALQAEDIIDTAPAGFVQIEYADGGRLGIGPQARLMLAPRGPLGSAAAPRVYLLQGWIKLSQPFDKPLPPDAVSSLTPSFEASAFSGASILVSSPAAFALFVENGSVKLAERNSGRPAQPLPVGSFFNVPAGEKPSLASRPSNEFLQQMPRPFRDPLPLRGARFRDNPVAPKSLGDVAYEDMAAWLVAEPGVRAPMMERWRPRLRDKAFRASMIGNLAAHPEWDPLLFPEKAAKKKAEEKRLREQRAVAAAAAAAAAKASAPRAPE